MDLLQALFQFHHVHREANVTADALVKEGVFRTSITFDV